MSATARARRTIRRTALPLAPLLALGLAACVQSGEQFSVDRAQGTSENISSLTQTISANPGNPEGYNVRGQALTRAGRLKEARADFDRAIQLNGSYYQAYANRALVRRGLGEPVEAVSDYNTALRLKPDYDAALIGRGEV